VEGEVYTPRTRHDEAVGESTEQHTDAGAGEGVVRRAGQVERLCRDRPGAAHQGRHCEELDQCREGAFLHGFKNDGVGTHFQIKMEMRCPRSGARHRRPAVARRDGRDLLGKEGCGIRFLPGQLEDLPKVPERREVRGGGTRWRSWFASCRPGGWCVEGCTAVDVNESEHEALSSDEEDEEV